MTGVSTPVGHAQEFLTLRSGYVYAMCRCGWTGRTHGYVLRSQAVAAYNAHKDDLHAGTP